MIRLFVVNTLKALGTILGVLGIGLAIHPILTISLLLLGAATFVGIITTYDM